jgi:hypothetical protein
MTYAELKAQFTALLQRTDLTSALTTTFMDMAMLRAARELRVPAQELFVETTVDGSYDGITVPAGFKQLIQISISGEPPLTYITPATYLSLTAVGGVPTVYTRHQGKFQLYPTPEVDQVILMDYWGAFEAFASDADETEMSIEYPDLLIYGALSYAADYFLDERAISFEQRYASIRDTLQEQASTIDGAVEVQPTVQFDDGQS